MCRHALQTLELLTVRPAFRWVVDSIVESVMESFDTDGDDTMDFKDFTKLVRCYEAIA